MHYRLLRNNKESGPYTALQLQEMGLKPYDLLWTEGRGAAWQYASEIPELKAFAPVIEDQPFDRFYKKEEPKNNAKENVSAAKKAKPRFRISGDKIIMVEAGNMEVATNGSIQTTTQNRFVKETVEEKVAAQPHWQEMYEEWQPQPTKKTSHKEAPVEVETKYAGSLDDLKKRYAEKVLNEKNDTPSAFKSANLKQSITAAIALLVLAVGGYVGYTLKQKDGAKTNSSAVVEKADVAGDNTLSPQQQSNDNSVSDNTQKNIVSNNSANKSNEKTNGTTSSTQEPVAKNENKELANASSKKELNNAAKTNDATHKALDKTTALNEKKKEAITGNNADNNNKPAPQTDASTTAKNGSGSNTATPPVATPAVKQAAPKKIEDYVAVKKIGGSGNAVENVRLLVNNITDFPIDLAVIDVQYFDSKGKFQKGETMYIKNIDGGNNVEVRVPDSEKSSSIKYRVSLVSSEKKTLYLVAD